MLSLFWLWRVGCCVTLATRLYLRLAESRDDTVSICYFTIGLLTVLGARWLRVTWPLLLVCRVTCYDMRVRSRLVARMVGLGLLTFTSFGARCHIDIHILLIFSRERTAWSYMQHGLEATAALAIMM